MDNSDYKSSSSVSHFNNFLYLRVIFHCTIFALLDTGSSINLMSRNLYESLSKRNKSVLFPVEDDRIILANKQEVKIEGVATITGVI